MGQTHLAVFAAEVPPEVSDREERMAGGLWVLELLVPALEASGFTEPVLTEETGYWHLGVQGAQRSVGVFVNDLSPVFVCEVPESRTFGEWLRRATAADCFKRAFDIACEFLSGHDRIGRILTYSGIRRAGAAFVGRAIDSLEKELGIYSD